MQPRFFNFAPIEKHGVIGDRRTATVVAADGTVDWFCVPDYDDDVIFGGLLDPDRGGFCRFGPDVVELGDQRYEDETVSLITRWRDGARSLELSDLMPWPEHDCPKEKERVRVILRLLRAERGDSRVTFEVRPRGTFEEKPRTQVCDGGVKFSFVQHVIALWTSFPVECGDDGARVNFTLREGEEAWAMIGLNEEPSKWSVARCRELHDGTKKYWRDWTGKLKTFPRFDDKLKRSAITVHLLAHSPTNAVVAAVTTSLPERIGGDRNYDYRYTWVRDASLSAAFLATMGQPDEVSKYLDWICSLASDVDAPLQVCYRTDGGTRLTQREVKGVEGYLDSRPVLFGNRAFGQRQLGSLGWFADCALIFLQAGGKWKPEFWKMLKRAADHVCRAWHEPDSGVWELEIEAHYVASKVMAWVTVDRAMRIAEKVGQSIPKKWEETARAIREEVVTKGWSESLQAFRQRYDSDALDAGSLLIPLMKFLPPDDPRVLSTLDAIERELVIDGLVHRFDPSATLGGEQLPLHAFEGAFLPATFWFAHALADAGRAEKAAKVLHACEEIAGPLGIFAEEADARRKCFLGNTPLLFSQVEYGRALIALHENEHGALL